MVSNVGGNIVSNPVVQVAGASAPIVPAKVAATAPQPTDGLKPLSAVGSVPARGLSLTLDAKLPQIAQDNTRVAPSVSVAKAQVASIQLKGAAGGPVVNMPEFMRGFASGTQLDIGATGFFGSGSVGGDGGITTLTTAKLLMNLNVTSPFGSENLQIDLRQENGHYKLVSPTEWNVDVTRAGSTVTITNADNPKEKIEIMNPKPGELRFLTTGLDQDGRTFIATAK